MNSNLSPNSSGSLLSLKSSLCLHQGQPISWLWTKQGQGEGHVMPLVSFVCKIPQERERERTQHTQGESMRGQQSQGLGTSRHSSQWQECHHVWTRPLPVDAQHGFTGQDRPLHSPKGSVSPESETLCTPSGQGQVSNLSDISFLRCIVSW